MEGLTECPVAGAKCSSWSRQVLGQNILVRYTPTAEGRLPWCCRAAGAGEHLQVQHCEQLLDLDHEHRFVVAHQQVLTGSPYRVGGRAWRPGLTSSRSADAAAFARDAVAHLGEDCPSACSLDVAWDVAARRWVVVEANPLWASTPYSCDPEVFVDAVEVSTTTGAGRWAWRPEETQLRRARTAAPVVAVPEADATGYAEFSG